MTAAIWYQPEDYSTKGPRLMGRHAAGELFLRGLVTHSKSREFWALVQEPEQAATFAATVRSLRRDASVKVVDRSSLHLLAKPGVLYFPGPDIGAQAWQRSTCGHGAWSVCGITHTTSSAAAMRSLVDLVTAPVYPWDALICTSSAVKDNVCRVVQAQVDHLQDRLGTSKVVLPRMPVIPLGVHTQDFAHTADHKQRARQALGVDADTVVVLFMGRLSFHAKAHPLAMYQALQVAARSTAKQVLLVECGWHAHESIETAFAEAAQLVCPGVRVLTLDGRKAQDRQTAWAGADVFCSLSDNIQETFGIAPIEAMAAGLPLVVADWDGYKDTVRDGVDGIRVPTLMPGPGLGGDLARRHALRIDSYDLYCGHASSLVAVDIQATARAFEQLFASTALRRQMGDAGQLRARQVYDWKSIIAQYEALWSELTDVRRAGAPNLTPAAQTWPARLDPFDAFAGYPTSTLSAQTLLGLVDLDADTAFERARRYRKLGMVRFADAVLPSEAEVQAVLQAAQSGPQSAAMLVQRIAADRRASVFRALTWLVKLGLLKLN